jgi:hypothetical protein
MSMRTLFAAVLLFGIASSPLEAACPGGPSTYFTVTGEVNTPSRFYLNDLEQLSAAQANVTYFAAGSVITQSFTGALLWDLLNSQPVGGIVVDPNTKNDILRKIIIVTGSDCYQSVFGAGENNPAFGGSQIMVAYAVNGGSLGANAFARIVVPGDKQGGRFVSNIVNIDVEDASSFPMLPPSKPHW